MTVNGDSSAVPARLLLAESRLRPAWTLGPQGGRGGAMARASAGDAARGASSGEGGDAGTGKEPTSTDGASGGGVGHFTKKRDVETRREK